MSKQKERDGSQGAVQTSITLDKTWDKVSQIILKTGAKRAHLASEATNVLVKLAIYARYSTDHQKASSIERQVGGSEKLALNKLGQKDYLLFTDIGKSAATMSERDGLLALIAAIERGEITDVIIEDFDRLSREVYDAAELGRIFEDHNVKLWLVSLGRHISKMELFEHAQHAEKDRIRRTTLLSSGIDQLVEAGGMPQGARFGYLESDRPGFPTICPIESLAVKRLFELALTLSDTDTAMQLKREGFISPNGTVDWDRGAVCRLRKRMTFIGVIHHRRTKQTRKKDGKRSRVQARPQEEWVSGHNENFRIVSDELFLAVHMKKLGKSGYKVPKADDAPRRLYLLGNPVCDCAEAEPGQLFENGNDLLCCRKGAKFANCTRSFGQDIQSRDIEKEGARLLVETLASVLSEEGLRTYVKESIQPRVAAHEAKRAHIAALLDDANRNADKLLDLIVAGSEKRLQQRLQVLEKEVENHETALARMPRISVDRIDFAAADTNLREALSLLEGRIPFIVQKSTDETTFGLFRRLIKRVVIERAGLATGLVGIKLELALDELFMDVEAAAALDPHITVVRSQLQLQRSYKTDPAKEELSNLAASGVHALTDEQWSRVKHLLPDMSARMSNVKHVLPTRQVADALIFKMRTGVAAEHLPAALGPPTELRFCVERLTRAGAAEILIDILGSADPDWKTGLTTKGLTALRAKRPLSERSTQIARRLAKSGDYRFTDDQWSAFEAVIGQDHLGCHEPLDAMPVRRLIEGVFLKLRARCDFKTLDRREFGPSDRVVVASRWLVNSGVWRRIVAVCAAHFPELLDGLDLDFMRRQEVAGAKLKERLGIARKNKAQAGARAIDICSKLLKAPAGAAGMMVFRSLVAPSPGKGKSTYIRPHIVIAPAKPPVGQPCRNPSVVIMKTAKWRSETDQQRVGICRRIRGLQHLIFVNQDFHRVEHHRKVDNRWVVEVMKSMDEKIDIAEVGATISLSEIYQPAT